MNISFSQFSLSFSSYHRKVQSVLCLSSRALSTRTIVYSLILTREELRKLLTCISLSPVYVLIVELKFVDSSDACDLGIFKFVCLKK